MAQSIGKMPMYIWKIGVVVLVAIMYCFSPGFQDFLKAGMSYLWYRDFEGLREFILGYGQWAPVMSIGLIVIQSLFPVVPGLLITITNAWIFGWQHGSFYSWVGALLAAILDFGIARWYGRAAIEGFVSHKYLTMSDVFLKRYGVVAIFITRLLPIIPFKIVSYGAGLTTMSLSRFVFATAVGQAPAIVLYSILGHNIRHHIHTIIGIVSVFVVMGVIVYYYREPIKNKFFIEKE